MAIHPLSDATKKWLADPVPFRIGGRPVAEGDLRALVNPATELEFAHVFSGTVDHVDQAVAQAQKTFRSGEWAEMNASMRARIMWRLADLIDAHGEEFGGVGNAVYGQAPL